MFTLVRRKKVDDHVPVIQDKPAFLGLAFYATFLLIVLLGGFEDGFCERFQHAVAGAVADHKIIGKGCDVFNVEKQDVFALLVLQGGDDLVSKFECVQISPHKLDSTDLTWHSRGLIASSVSEVVVTF